MISIRRIEPSEWLKVSEITHKVVFEEVRPPELERIDYALLCEDENQKPLMYLTAKEFDSETVYWQYGGSFPETYGTSKAVDAYSSLLNWTEGKYKRVSQLVHNENVRYLKLSMHFGFRIIGMRVFNQEIFLEMIKLFKKEGD